MQIERELKNGKRYSFTELFKGYIQVYCYYGNDWHQLTNTFKSWEEVDEWCSKMDYDFEHPKEWTPSAPPSDYYDDCRRYYGD